jgi:hypothetical protein
LTAVQVARQLARRLVQVPTQQAQRQRVAELMPALMRLVARKPLVVRLPEDLPE